MKEGKGQYRLLIARRVLLFCLVCALLDIEDKKRQRGLATLTQKVEV